MELQRVLAEDTRRAMEKVIQLYGEDALVVSNNRAKDKTEIIVAIDVAADTQKTLNEMHFVESLLGISGHINRDNNFGFILGSVIGNHQRIFAIELDDFLHCSTRVFCQYSL